MPVFSLQDAHVSRHQNHCGDKEATLQAKHTKICPEAQDAGGWYAYEVVAAQSEVGCNLLEPHGPNRSLQIGLHAIEYEQERHERKHSQTDGFHLNILRI